MDYFATLLMPLKGAALLLHEAAQEGEEALTRVAPVLAEKLIEVAAALEPHDWLDDPALLAGARRGTYYLYSVQLRACAMMLRERQGTLSRFTDTIIPVLHETADHILKIGARAFAHSARSLPVPPTAEVVQFPGSRRRRAMPRRGGTGPEAA